MLVALFAGIGFCAALAFAVAWRLNTGFDPFQEAFGDLPNTLHPTDAHLLDQLRAVEGSGCEVGFHSTLNSQER